MYVFPKKVTLLITARQSVQYDLLHRCVTPQLSLLLFCFVPFHYDMTTWNLLRRSFSLKGLVQSSKKSQRKKKSLQRYRAKRIKRQLYGKYYAEMTGQNDRQDETWPVKSTIMPDTVRSPAVILSPVYIAVALPFQGSLLHTGLTVVLKTGQPIKFEKFVVAMIRLEIQ